MSESFDNQIFYRPRCYYFRMVFHREPSAETVRMQGLVLCEDSMRVIVFARNIGLEVSNEVVEALMDARFGFINRDVEMGKVRWRGLELCNLIEPLHRAIRNYGREMGVELYPPKFYMPPDEVIDALIAKSNDESLAG
ncbi:hypothetical protein [Rubellicoccus peritrichatus]|uniref:Uncharacterized protein n=1 Tax=Rubellicoccus peritrichatus TaxID=3080537 RepID=A0AAQ3LCF1_9BACT|nr:hypothetical protein [Puniceicoccus sp. CR14]WOO43115.1 hypothetical protein RZN69_08420 [Puniceicoccus sp. CR14]